MKIANLVFNILSFLIEEGVTVLTWSIMLMGAGIEFLCTNELDTFGPMLLILTGICLAFLMSLIMQIIAHAIEKKKPKPYLILQIISCVISMLIDIVILVAFLGKSGIDMLMLDPENLEDLGSWIGVFAGATITNAVALVLAVLHTVRRGRKPVPAVSA